MLNSIPATLRYAISVGIGMFIAFIGLKNAGIIVSRPASFVTFRSLHARLRISIDRHPVEWTARGEAGEGSLCFIASLICTLIGIPLGVTYDSRRIPAYLHAPLAGSHLLSIRLQPVVHARYGGDYLHAALYGYVRHHRHIGRPYLPDRDCGKRTAKFPSKRDYAGRCHRFHLGAILVVLRLPPFWESASGVAEGGRSGFTSLVTGGMFLLSIFFAPIFLLIPGAATTGALVLVGVFMMESITQIDMKNIAEALPAFITIITMVLTYPLPMASSWVCFAMCCSNWARADTGRLALPCMCCRCCFSSNLYLRNLLHIII